MLIGAVADDLTGATDLALMLARGGMRTVQVMGVPSDPGALAGYEAVVVALKSRTIPAAEAVKMSLDSADALLAAGARQIIFKYCSTFDSTDDGNIGPVAEALLERTGGDLTLACPAFPTNKRTVYRGHLFVGDVLLSDSPMKDHPLTPMRDANLVNVLARQTTLPVGLVAYEDVEAGAGAIRAAFARERDAGRRVVVVDAVSDRHLRAIGEAAADMTLITGGSGIAIGLPANFVRAGLMKAAPEPASLPAKPGRAAILAGSCSVATRGQVAQAEKAGIPAYRIDPTRLAEGAVGPVEIVEWAKRQGGDGPVLVYSSADPDAVQAAQAKLGRDKAGAMVEDTLAQVAQALVADGATRLIVAGGETSGAVVGALGIETLEIGPEIDPGVPWTREADERGLALALKSGNFGAPDFFVKAWNLLQ